MILKGKKVTLRPLEFEDLEFVRSLINDPEMESKIVGWSYPVSKKDEEQWYSSYHNNECSIRYIIETEENGRVGFTGIKDIDWKNGSCSGAGIRLMQKENMSKGIATDTYMTMLRYVFEELRLHRFNASALSDNLASLRFQEKCGFKREGVKREAIFKKGKYHDQIITACLKSDYEFLCEKNHYWDI